MDFPYMYIYSVNLVKLADVKPVSVRVLEALLHNHQRARTVFLRDPSDVQKNVGSGGKSDDL